jgi:hypothetical protein
MAWDFVMGFARDNQLQVIQTEWSLKILFKYKY